MDKFPIERLEELLTDDELKELEEAVYKYYRAMENFKECAAEIFRYIFERLDEDDS